MGPVPMKEISLMFLITNEEGRVQCTTKKHESLMYLNVESDVSDNKREDILMYLITDI